MIIEVSTQDVEAVRRSIILTARRDYRTNMNYHTPSEIIVAQYREKYIINSVNWEPDPVHINEGRLFLNVDEKPALMRMCELYGRFVKNFKRLI